MSDQKYMPSNNHQNALYAGMGQLGNQQYQQNLPGPGCENVAGWKPMSSAPRDGTVIEVRCTYGVAPWYGLYRWSNKETIIQDGIVHEWNSSAGRWMQVGNDAIGFSEDASFSWRSYVGEAQNYIDPTCGRQNDPQYWRQAAARSVGLPSNYFEKPWWKFW